MAVQLFTGSRVSSNNIERYETLKFFVVASYSTTSTYILYTHRFPLLSVEKIGKLGLVETIRVNVKMPSAVLVDRELTPNKLVLLSFSSTQQRF